MRGLASPHPILGAICGLSAVAVHQHRRRHPFRAANADPHGPVYSADYRVSTVAVRFRCLMSLLCWSCCVRIVRVHSSSCGAHRDVHSPLDWLYHRCHCKCRDFVFVGRLRSVYVAMSCGGGFFTPGAAYDSVWDSVKPMTGNFFKYFQYQEFVECVCMLNGWFSNNDDICPDNYNYSRFTLKDKCRSEKWEVYLHGDMTIKVMGPDVQKTAEISAVAFHGVTGRLFSAVYTGTRPGFPPPSGRGRGGGDAGSLLPGVLPPELGASHARARTDSPCR